jgi:hypothetical protein
MTVAVLHGLTRLGAAIAGNTERLAAGDEVGVHKEILEAGVGDVLLDAPADGRAGSTRPRRPRPARAVGAFRKPAAARRAAKEPLMLPHADRELEPDALVPRKQWQEPVGRRRTHDLDPPGAFLLPEGADYVAADRAPERLELAQPLAPELRNRQQVAFAGCRQ